MSIRTARTYDDVTERHDLDGTQATVAGLQAGASNLGIPIADPCTVRGGVTKWPFVSLGACVVAEKQEKHPQRAAGERSSKPVPNA